MLKTKKEARKKRQHSTTIAHK